MSDSYRLFYYVHFMSGNPVGFSKVIVRYGQSIYKKIERNLFNYE